MGRGQRGSLCGYGKDTNVHISILGSGRAHFLLWVYLRFCGSASEGSAVGSGHEGSGKSSQRLAIAVRDTVA
jgi:hypothetical protein